MHADVCPQLTSSARDFGQATSSGSLPSGCLLPMGLGSSRNELPTPDFCLFCCASYTDTKKYRIAISKYVPHCDQGAKAPSVHLRRPPTSGSCMCCASQYIAVAQARTTHQLHAQQPVGGAVARYEGGVDDCAASEEPNLSDACTRCNSRQQGPPAAKAGTSGGAPQPQAPADHTDASTQQSHRLKVDGYDCPPDMVRMTTDRGSRASENSWPVTQPARTTKGSTKMAICAAARTTVKLIQNLAGF